MATKETRQKAGELLGRIGVQKQKKWAAFENVNQKKFGSAYFEFMHAVGQRMNNVAADVYRAKHSSLHLSLAITSQYDSSYLHAFLTWLIGELNEPPAKVLDVGCDNGVMSCACALTWPTAEVLGVDDNEHAILRARELAGKLGLTNVRFELTDIRAGISSLGKFDVVLANLVLHEAFRLKQEEVGRFEIDPSPRWDLSEVRPRAEDKQLLAWLSDARSALHGDRSLFISVNRLSSPDYLWWWHQMLQESGYRVSLSRSYMLEMTNVQEEEESLPITVAKIGGAGFPKSSAQDALSFFAYPKLLEQPIKAEYDLAETLFKAFGAKSLLFRAETVFSDGSGIGRIELWDCATVACAYEMTDKGYRRLHVFPQVGVFEQLARILPEVERSRDSGKVSASLLFTDELRDLARRLDVEFELVEGEQQAA